MMKLGLWLGLILLTLNAYSSEKGNGGSGTESQLASQQAQLELISMKIRTFFLQNESALKDKFPEFDIKTLTQKIKYSDIHVVNKDELIDKHGKSRTCLNFPESSLIECKYSDIESLMNEPAAIFVLIFHEYLGLIGAEETSPENPRMIDGYTISKRLATYVSLMTSFLNNYDLGLAPPAMPVTDFKYLKTFAPKATITNSAYSIVPKNTKKIKIQIESKEATLSNTSFNLYARSSSSEEERLVSHGTFEDVPSNRKVAYINFEAGNLYSLRITGDVYLLKGFLDFGFFPHTERVVLTTEDDFVIFDSEEVVFEIDKDDPNYELYYHLNSMTLDIGLSLR